MPISSGNTLLVELRPILYIHLHPQTSKRFHLCFHLGRANHPERIKYLSQALGAEPANVQGIADLGTVGAECLFGSAVFILAAAQRDRLGGQLAYPVPRASGDNLSGPSWRYRLPQLCFLSGAVLHKGTVLQRFGAGRRSRRAAFRAAAGENSRHPDAAPSPPGQQPASNSRVLSANSTF